MKEDDEEHLKPFSAKEKLTCFGPWKWQNDKKDSCVSRYTFNL